MNLLKRIFFFGILLCAVCFSNSLSAQDKISAKGETTDVVTFAPEDIQKVKALIENQLGRSISQEEFNGFGKVSKENLSVYKAIDKNLKDDPFFSQPHVSYLIEKMEERLGINKPRSRRKVSESNSKRKTTRKM